ELERRCGVAPEGGERRGELRLKHGILDRCDDLDAMVEVARHQVGAAYVEGAPVRRLEDEEATVFEKAAENAADPNVRAQLGNARTQGADAADEQVDLRARLRRRVELVDQLGMREAVHLDPDVRLLAVSRGVGNGADLLHQTLAQRERRDEQLAE